tara:strand:+ start:1859 stop:3013 length:1155 start_codon:yes stop_codon:yes gene_type:complete
MLPITPPDYYDSPYASSSAFAGWTELVKSTKQISMDNESYWLEDWALFCTIKQHHQNQPWTDWPIELRDRHPEALEEWRAKIEPELLKQMSFQAGWNELHNYATDKGISLVGDVPIFVAHDSADVWAHRHLFQLEEDGQPSFVAGVPPDYFSEDGQRWGTVLYRWESHRIDNYKWWRERIARVLRLFDKVRIDHFRGFHSAWAIPTQDEHARNGFWQEGPGDEILQQLIEEAGGSTKIIAEDLGIIPSEVIELRKRHQLNGMAVLQFGFDGNITSNPHYPPNIENDLVVYTGTHDNNTTRGWLNNLGDESINTICKLVGSKDIDVSTIINLALGTRAELVIIPLQDILNLDSNARMNTPGTDSGNWSWAFTWDDLQNNFQTKIS